MRRLAPSVMFPLLLIAAPARGWDTEFTLGSSTVNLNDFRDLVRAHALAVGSLHTLDPQVTQNESPQGAVTVRGGVRIPMADRLDLLADIGYWGTPGKLLVTVESSGTGNSDAWDLDFGGFETHVGGNWRLLGRADGWHLLSHLKLGFLYLSADGTRKTSPGVDQPVGLRGGAFTAELGTTWGLGGRRVFMDFGWRILGRIGTPKLAGPLDYGADGTVVYKKGTAFPGGAPIDLSGFCWRIGLRF